MIDPKLKDALLRFSRQDYAHGVTDAYRLLDMKQLAEAYCQEHAADLEAATSAPKNSRKKT